MNRKHYFPVALLLVAAMLAIITRVAQTGYIDSQTISVQLTARDIPAHGLLVLSPPNPEFDTLITTRFGKGNPIVDALKPFSVLIKNVGDQAVVAYSLRWELLRDDGRVLTQTRDYITAWRLMGVEGSDKDGITIQPGSFVLMTPSNLDFAQGAEAIRAGNPELLMQASEIRTQLRIYSNISVTIDGAFFEDGRYVGPDNSGLFSRVATQLSAKRDLCLEVTQELKRGEQADHVFKQVEELASGPRVELAPSSTKEDVYKKFKKDAAEELLRFRSASGDAKAKEFATQLLSNKWPELRKVQ